jgi:hypothetical protein
MKITTITSTVGIMTVKMLDRLQCARSQAKCTTSYL